jgi:hypothetical protein
MNSLSGHSLTIALTLTPLLLFMATARTDAPWPATLTPEKAVRERVLTRCCSAIVSGVNCC